MSGKALEIFRLCERLAELLGDEEAVADLKLLYEHHPEMFKDKEEVREVIKKTLINEMLKTQDELNAMPRASAFHKDFEKDLEQSFNVRTDDENKFKTRLKKQ